MMEYILVVIIGYLIGSISFSVIFSRKFAGFDVREKGSKSAGTTNVLRNVGKKAAAITLICDILKGSLAVLIAYIIGRIWSTNIDILALGYLAGFGAILGHTFPIFFEFRGGKGVATALGVMLALNPQVALICLIFAIILIALTKMVSVGSILAAILFPILILFMTEKPSIWVMTISIAIAVLIVLNHRGNIQRIRKGMENKINLKK